MSAEPIKCPATMSRNMSRMPRTVEPRTVEPRKLPRKVDTMTLSEDVVLQLDPSKEWTVVNNLARKCTWKKYYDRADIPRDLEYGEASWAESQETPWADM